jgi:multiple sugar transport system substrate-binding protein
MSSKRTPAKIFGSIGIGLLMALSLFPPASGTSRELLVLMEPDGTGGWRELANRFNASHPEVPVRLVEGPPSTDTREDMYSTAFLAGKNGYDVVYCDVVWVPKFAAAGWLMDLSDRLSESDRADFLKADLDGGTYQGKLYRIPAFTDAGVLYYRTDLVRNPPETFDELRAAASSLRSENMWGYVWQGKQYEGLITNYLEILWGYGGDWITPERTVALDSPEALEALLFLKSAIGNYSPPGVTSYSEEEARNIFQNGRSAFLRNWFYVWNLANTKTSKVQNRIGFVPMVHAPGQRGASSLGGWGFAISKLTPHPEAAWSFVEFLSAPEQLRVLQDKMGRVPSRRSMVPEHFRTIVANARPRPQIPEYAPASDILQRWLSSALSGDSDPQQALHAATEETRALLREKRNGS